jgi:cell division protein FtsI (penicillin-binding protein 3)
MKPVRRFRPYNRARLTLVVGLFGIGFLAILGRLFAVQIVRHADLQAQALEMHIRHVTLRPERGRMLDRHGHVLATSIAVPSISARPREIRAPESVAVQLANVLERPVSVVRQQLTSKSPFVWIARQVTPEIVTRLQALRLPGIYFEKETRRYYPKRHLAGQVLGYVGVDEQGLGGLEHLYNRELSGQPRRLTWQRDAMGRAVRLLTEDAVEQPRGADLYLTLDERLQSEAEKQIAAQVQQTRAKGGLVIIMQPQTGDILAMAAYPFFNPNDFREASQQVWQRNRAVTDPVEPGSTFKLVVAAASLEESTVRPGEVFFCENGLLVRGGRRIRDHEPYGQLRFAEVFEHSSNICTIKISERLSPFMLYHYIRRFGFGEKTLVDVPGEDAGQLRPPQQWSRFSHASLAIGQEIGVTPLQLVTAYAAVANGGLLMRPRMVERLVDGEEVQEFPVEIRRRALAPETAERLMAIFTGVVKRGTGKSAAIEGYTVAGKTGTAQKPDRGRYSHQKIVASFVGFVPAEAPQLVMLVLVDEPQTLRWGSQAAAPVFKRIAQEALRHLQIPPRHAWPLTVEATAPQPAVYAQGGQGALAPLLTSAPGSVEQRVARARE